jgi:hypothetical protein
MTMPDGTAIVAVLGKASDSKEVQDLLRQLGAKPPKLKKGNVDAYVVLDDQGLELLFSDEAYVTKRKDLARGEGKLLLTTAWFKIADPPKVASYAEALPHGLAFTKSKGDVHKLLGKPEWANADPDIRRERWSVASHKIVVRYTEKLSGLEQVIASLPDDPDDD